MNAAEIAVRRGRKLAVGAELRYGEPVRLVRDEEAYLHGTTLKVRPTLVLGREHTDAFPAAFEETVRDLH